MTSTGKLGVQGGSNGGLLTGNMLTRSPDLFGALLKGSQAAAAAAAHLSTHPILPPAYN